MHADCSVSDRYDMLRKRINISTTWMEGETMNVSELSEKIRGRILTGKDKCERQITGVYCGDLLSWVMSHAPRGSAWITVHNHVNIIAVAALTELSCIIIPEGIEAEETTLKKADAEGVTIISTDLSTYDICCIAHDCGI
jgi:predicted transcriptional regulator